MKMRIISALAVCAGISAPTVAEPTALADCRSEGFTVDTVIVSEQFQSPRQFRNGMVTLFQLQTNHSPYAGAGFAINYYPGEGENMACMGRDMFSSVNIAAATAVFVEGEGLTITIPGTVHSGSWNEETEQPIFDDVITVLRYNPDDGSLIALSDTE
ncbi:hypothetical protein HFP51_06660 [Parasphingopyxis sp. CP4]|uniref:hypothetical protein n=1 Tax=Parasphingopyxis sp. CP4 TaxID=2724527 RepID=UPI0015A00A60|nr:hypothetical protein [Parasphingopyxis sp. CP4]QLC21891.1 hypothetical protein HFP51_06660 [Parasphingopyxis sp. CP4]